MPTYMSFRKTCFNNLIDFKFGIAIDAAPLLSLDVWPTVEHLIPILIDDVHKLLINFHWNGGEEAVVKFRELSLYQIFIYNKVVLAPAFLMQFSNE